MSTATADVADALTRLIRGIHCSGQAAARHRSESWDKSMFALLDRLAEAGPQRASTLAEEIHLDLSTVSRQVAHLVADGLVRRCPDPADRRASQLMLTPAGARFLAYKAAERREWIARIVNDWTPAEQTEFAGYLHRFSAALEQVMPTLLAELSARQDTPDSKFRTHEGATT